MNNKDYIESLLLKRHESYLEWVEPSPSMLVGTFQIANAHITSRATVHDCVNMQRYIESMSSKKFKHTDKELLEDFIISNNAKAFENYTDKQLEKMFVHFDENAHLEISEIVKKL